MVALKILIYTILLSVFLIESIVHAYINVTYLNTTVVLGTNSTGKVVEILSLYLSNNISINQYLQDRAAINLTLSDWQRALNTNLLVEHILNPSSSVSNFTFLPGPVTTEGDAGIAQIIMSYYVHNITTVKEIAPRKFEYTFNDNVFNFMHTASGEALPLNARLNIIIPSRAQVVSIYPLPDYPSVNVFGKYTNESFFSWYAGEPLSGFTFTYIVTQSLGQEVTSYFGMIFSKYRIDLFAFVLLIIIAIAVYFLVTSKQRV